MLVVESDVVSRKMLCKLLNSLSYDCDSCASCMACVELVRRRPRKYIAVFMNLIHNDGCIADTIAFLRKELDIEVPIIIVTANVCIADRLKLGADELLEKPVQQKKLLETMSRYRIGLSSIRWKDGSESLFKQLSSTDLAIMGMCNAVGAL